MLRKKNIILNGKRASGNEVLKAGDEIRLYFSDETYKKFRGREVTEESGDLGDSGLHNIDGLIVYEDENILLLNKPPGMLSQRDGGSRSSANEYIAEYLSGKEEGETSGFKPSVCNRLDRNTSGLLIFAKNYASAREISESLRERTIKKYYLAIVCGMPVPGRRTGYLTKDHKSNRVRVCELPSAGASFIETDYRIIKPAGALTLIRAELLTGKSHQIRAQLSSMGFPIAGDPKYGDKRVNEELGRRFGVRSQLLHAYELVLPEFKGILKGISGKSFKAPLPGEFEKVMRGVDGNLEFKGTQGLYS